MGHAELPGRRGCREGAAGQLGPHAESHGMLMLVIVDQAAFPRQILHRWLHRALQVIEQFQPAGRLDGVLHKIETALERGDPHQRSFSSQRDVQQNGANAARRTFQRLELDIIDHSRPLYFTRIQHILDWLGLGSFDDDAHPLGLQNLETVSCSSLVVGCKLQAQRPTFALADGTSHGVV